MEKRNILLTIEYDGSGFCGWQRQPGKRTVQGELERVLSVLCACEIKLNGTSRTDAGVHALGQRAGFCGEFGIPTDRIARAANNLLAGSMNNMQASDVRIVRAEEVSPEFHARFDAKGKKYIYRINNTGVADVFRRNYEYFVERPLDLEAMQKAAEYIVGEHDFACFQAAGGQPRKTTVRTIYSLDVKAMSGQAPAASESGSVVKAGGCEADRAGGVGQAGGIEISVVGDGFLYNMVRIITGTLVDVGLGKINSDALPAIIKSCDRQRAGHTAPPQGLYLAEVYYGSCERMLFAGGEKLRL